MDKYQLEENLREDRIRNRNKFAYRLVLVLFGVLIWVVIMLLVSYPLYEQRSIQSDSNCIVAGTGAIIYANPIIKVEPIILPYQQPNTGVN